MVKIRSRERRGQVEGDRGPAGDPLDGADDATGTAIGAADTDGAGGDGAGAADAASASAATDEASPLETDAAADRVELRFEDGADDDPSPRFDRGGRRITDATTRARLENLAKGRRARLGRKATRTRPPGDDDEKPKAAPKRSDFRLDRAAVSGLLDIVDAMTSAQLGERAKFNSRERDLIEPSLARIIARMTPEAAAKFAQFSDPLMLGTGLLLWGVRVFGQVGPGSESARPPTPIRPQPTPAQPAPATPSDVMAPNGVAPPPDHLADAWAAASP